MKAARLVGVVAIGLLAGCGSQSGDPDGGPGGSGGDTGAGDATPSQGGTGSANGGGEAGAGSGARPETTTSTSSPDAGTNTRAPADGGSGPTFTQLYNDILVVSCSGGACHDPGMQKGISFATQSAAYTAVRNRVLPGDGEGSSFFFTVNSGEMPLGGPKLTATNLGLIKAWIDAGALED